MNKKQKRMLARIVVAFAMMVGLHFTPASGWARFALYLAPYLVIGYDILIKAAKGIKNRQMFDESFLMAVATDIRPDYANVERGGALEKVDPDEVGIGSVIVVQPGEKVPIDGVVVDGASSLNTSALTGESVPRDVKQGDEIISGCINMTGVLKVRTTKEFGESTVSKILDLVENASSRKSKSEDFITKFARVYTPAVARLHARSLRRGSCARRAAASRARFRHGAARRVGYVDLPRADLPRHKLSLRARHQHTAVVLRGHRRREPRGRARQGLELPRDALADEDSRIRQDRHIDEGRL